MKKTIMGFVLLALIGCADSNGYHTIKPGFVCVDGVEYIYRYRMLAPHFKIDGSLYLCGEAVKK